MITRALAVWNVGIAFIVGTSTPPAFTSLERFVQWMIAARYTIIILHPSGRRSSGEDLGGCKISQKQLPRRIPFAMGTSRSKMSSGYYLPAAAKEATASRSFALTRQTLAATRNGLAGATETRCGAGGSSFRPCASDGRRDRSLRHRRRPLWADRRSAPRLEFPISDCFWPHRHGWTGD